ncbi:hypothetical protein niasHT_029708 [Heterodera trifolii]|uniref:RING-type domain-containing protein n=1 Tax=Heterodera trifolii TaxID=157864 RepID=A0ABD2KSC3_9BILA
MSHFLEKVKECSQTDNKCLHNCAKYDENDNNFNKKKRTKQLLQFVAKTIEIYEDGTTKRRKHLLNAFNEIPSTIVDTEFECAICLDSIPRNTSVKPLPACNHIFHEDCLSTCARRRQLEAPRAVLENRHGDNNWVWHPVFWA